MTRNTTEPSPSPNFPKETILFEVWRNHLKGGNDILVQQATTEMSATKVFNDCTDDETLKGFCTFYLVEVTVHRRKLT